MKPPVLQTRWLNRVFFDPHRAAPGRETFFVHAACPSGRRALWLRFSLGSRGRERFGEVHAMVVDGSGSAPRVACERLPWERVAVDPERGGVGIGESSLQEGACQGIARGADFAVSWNFTLGQGATSYLPLPADWLYRRPGVGPKMSLPHPCAPLRGRLELWHGLHRHVERERIELDGWQACQGHQWGTLPAARHAWVHCAQFEEAPAGSWLHVYGGPWHRRLLGGSALVGALQVGAERYRFDGWRQLCRGAPGPFTPHAWGFELRGEGNTVRAQLHAAAAASHPLTTAAAGAGEAPRQACAAAALTVELMPASGRKRLLRSSVAAYEMCAPQTAPLPAA